MVKYLKQHYIPVILGLAAFVYYFALSARTATWIFEGFDSGDWLAVATKWMVPQTYGSPLYMLLCRLVYLLPGNLQSNLTVALSVLPSSITIPTIFLTVKRVTGHSGSALASALVALGSAVLLSQSTIIEEYALTVMFITLAICSYAYEFRYRTVLFLSLAISVYLLVAGISVFWLLADRRWKFWLGKPLLIVVLVGILPYLSVPLLMAMDTPRFMADELTWVNLVSYYSTAAKAVVGTLSMADAPVRIGQLSRIVLMSFGLALVPLLHNIYKPLTRIVAMQIATIMFMTWFVFTCIDPAAWVFIIFITPAIAILCGIALSAMSRQHLLIVMASSFLLMATNAVFLNANVLTLENPRATTYQEQLRALPDGAVVVTSAGAYSMSAFYVTNEGKNIIPVVYGYVDAKPGSTDYGMHGFDKYLKKQTGVDWPSTLEGVQNCLNNNIPVYFVPTYNGYINDCFQYEPSFWAPSNIFGKPYKVLGLTGQRPNIPNIEGIYE